MLMKIITLGIGTVLLGFVLFSLPAVPAYAASAENCGQTSGGFLGFPTWYKYLNPTFDGTECKLDVTFPGAIPKILLAVVEIALRIGGVVAFGYVIYGGFKFILSNGEPDRAASARNSIINALVGLVIAIIAIGVVNFIGSTIR